jgi:hypothetical protein
VEATAGLFLADCFIQKQDGNIFTNWVLEVARTAFQPELVR